MFSPCLDSSGQLTTIMACKFSYHHPVLFRICFVISSVLECSHSRSCSHSRYSTRFLHSFQICGLLDAIPTSYIPVTSTATFFLPALISWYLLLVLYCSTRQTHDQVVCCSACVRATDSEMVRRSLCGCYSYDLRVIEQ